MAASNSKIRKGTNLIDSHGHTIRGPSGLNTAELSPRWCGPALTVILFYIIMDTIVKTIGAPALAAHAFYHHIIPPRYYTVVHYT